MRFELELGPFYYYLNMISGLKVNLASLKKKKKNLLGKVAD